MKSKTSCFNKTLFLKNITRFWPMWVLYLIILFFVMPMTLYQSTRPALNAMVSNLEIHKLDSMISCVSSGITVNLVLTFFISIGCAVLVFGYLFQSANCNMIHALPVTRKELFITNYISGLLFMVIPQIIAFLMTLVTCVINNVTCVEYLLYWLVVSLTMSFLFFSLAVFCCMLTGNVFAAGIYFCVINLVYVGIKYLIATLIDALCYGINTMHEGMGEFLSHADGILSPPAFLLTSVGLDRVYQGDSTVLTGAAFYGRSVLVIYLFAGAAALIAAFLFYKKRHLECAGDIVTFRWLNPVFRWGIAFCFGLGISMILANIFFDNNQSYAPALILFAVIFTLMSFFVSEMLLKKNFRIFTKKRWIEGIVCTALTLCLIGALRADLFHVERQIPAADEVKAAALTGSASRMLLTDQKDIEILTELHRSILDHKEAYQQATDAFYGTEYEESMEEENTMTLLSLDFTYYLNDGETLFRSYTVPLSAEELDDSESAASILNTLETNPEAFLQSTICKNYSEVTYQGGYVDLPLAAGNNSVYFQGKELNEEQAQQMYQAIEKDIREGNYPIGSKSFLISGKERYYNTIFLTGKVSKVISIFDDLPESRRLRQSRRPEDYPETRAPESEEVDVEFDVYPSCTNMIQAMIDLNLIEDESDLILISDYNELTDS